MIHKKELRDWTMIFHHIVGFVAACFTSVSQLLVHELNQKNSIKLFRVSRLPVSSLLIILFVCLWKCQLRFSTTVGFCSYWKRKIPNTTSTTATCLCWLFSFFALCPSCLCLFIYIRSHPGHKCQNCRALRSHSALSLRFQWMHWTCFGFEE